MCEKCEGEKFEFNQTIVCKEHFKILKIVFREIIIDKFDSYLFKMSKKINE